ncbi:cytoskeletal protein RodZ [Weissella uvarum]|uniref:LysM peptidoglycan-binding domain-containing protein n=1 Tax=Weissella uvarum TaxID=1479233 RepID=UPI0019611435|nr:LysM domain-containing protein [Weissella uvarum]MBM7617066.1 cytoskeletal protein RodZ [Weissella uvarum]MCM0595364.1 LysM peptidoglycan-binding domain-containing protein [Weissella uvarum]
MTDQDKKPEPWGESFKEDQPDQYSRTEHRKKTQRVSWTIGVLVAVVIGLSFVPIYEYLQTLNKPTNAEQTWSSASTSSTKITDSSKSKQASSKAASKSKSVKAASESKAQASKKSAEASSKAAAKAASESSAKAAAASSKAQQASQASSQRASSQSSQGDKQYTTVAAGQGAFRVATNAGISQSKLQELNPGVDLSAVHAGQRLRVK